MVVAASTRWTHDGFCTVSVGVYLSVGNGSNLGVPPQPTDGASSASANN